MRDVQKKLNLQSDELGSDCNCSKKCFERVPEATRRTIIKNFNLMESVNEQNSYLCGLISVLSIQRRRSRNDEAEANFGEASYSYMVRLLVDGLAKEEKICKTAFMSIHGIKRKKDEYLVSSLKATGNAPKDKRGKHQNHPSKLSDECLEAVSKHIKSFKSRTISLRHER
ncbi:hypothetical protein QE152_g7732 [Popillia japonica]|uniref:Uncharacterized protein n=1 Tax=Popillia japonica TaxID=7064 RepID=A0AAW1ME74_POPJA